MMFPTEQITTDTLSAFFGISEKTQIYPYEVEKLRTRTEYLSRLLIPGVLRYEHREKSRLKYQGKYLRNTFNDPRNDFRWHDLIHTAIAYERGVHTGTGDAIPPFFDRRYDEDEETRDRDELQALLFPISFSSEGDSTFLKLLQQSPEVDFETAFLLYQQSVLDKVFQRNFIHVLEITRIPDPLFKARARRIYDAHISGNTRCLLDELLLMTDSIPQESNR